MSRAFRLSLLSFSVFLPDASRRGIVFFQQRLLLSRDEGRDGLGFLQFQLCRTLIAWETLGLFSRPHKWF